MQSSIGTLIHPAVQPGGAQITFFPSSSGYKAAGFVLATLVHDPDGAWTYTRKARQIFTFSSTGELISTSDPNGSTTTYAYNTEGELSSITDPSGRSITLAYNAAGLVSSATGPDNESAAYGYDTAGNLTSVTGPGPVKESLSYNVGSELTSLSSGIGRIGISSTTYSYTPNGQRSAEQVGGLLGGGPAGGGTTLSYAWNGAGDLSSYSGPYGGSPAGIAGSGLPGASGHAVATKESYTYNGAGLLSSIATTTQLQPPPFLHGQRGHQPPHSAASTTEITWDTAGTTPLVLQDANAYFIYGPNGLPVEEIYAPSSSSTGASTSTVLYYLQDALGSTRALVTSSGNIAASYSYTPYGTLRCTSAGIGAGIPGIGMPPHSCGMPSASLPFNGASSCSPAANNRGPSHWPVHGTFSSCITQAVSANPFLFAGQFFDSTSGLYYMRARWYDPATGQFLSVDPLVATTNQPYQYAGDNPVSNTDTTGHCACSVLLGVAQQFLKMSVTANVSAVLLNVAIEGLTAAAGVLGFPELGVIMLLPAFASTLIAVEALYRLSSACG